MIPFLVVVVLVWLALLPPLFTDGACTAEFEAAAGMVERDRKALASPALADAYWGDKRIRHSVMPLQQCRRAKPRALPTCGDGALVTATIPVRNAICSLYRDDSVRIYLQYDDRDRLSRIQTEMSPYRSLPIPWLGTTLHWAK